MAGEPVAESPTIAVNGLKVNPRMFVPVGPTATPAPNTETAGIQAGIKPEKNPTSTGDLTADAFDKMGEHKEDPRVNNFWAGEPPEGATTGVRMSLEELQRKAKELGSKPQK